MSNLQAVIENLEKNAPMRLDQIVLSEVGKWQNHPKLKSMREGVRYYLNRNDIVNIVRTAIGEKGVRVPVTNMADHRIPSGFMRKLVDQKTGYSLSKEMNIQTDDEGYATVLEDIFDRNFQRMLKNLGKDAINKGIGWIHMYYDTDGILQRKRINPEEIIPFWSDEDHTELTALIRFYDVEEYIADREILATCYELWTKEGVLRFRSDTLNIPTSYDFHWFLDAYDAEGQILIDEETGESLSDGYNWERIPFIPFKYNSEEQPLIELVRKEIDAYDKIKSYLMNDIEDLPEQIIALYNYSGTNLSEFRSNLATYRAALFEKLGDVGEGGMEMFNTAIEISARQFALELLRKDIFEFGRGVDTQADKFATAPSGEAQKYLYADLDMDADGLESEFQFSLEQMLWFYDMDLINKGIGDFLNTPVSFIFNRDISINVTETINNLVNSDYLSLETRVAQNPFVDDVKAELQRIEDEKTADRESFTAEQYTGLAGGSQIPGATPPADPTAISGQANEE